MLAQNKVLLKVEGLSKSFGQVKAVQDVDITINRGEVVGLVGESGSGKTTVGRLMLRLVEPSAGHISFDGVEISDLPVKRMREMRKHMQIVFQDPFSSLTPHMRVGQIIEEPLIVHRLRTSRAERKQRVTELMELVGLRGSHASRFPHEFSGGQRQRIGIARALATEPSFIVADEAVSALDVSIQAQIINLLRSLQSDFNLTMLFISHDLGVIKHIADRTMVMYLGRIVEFGATDELFANPRHPYTKALISAIPGAKSADRGGKLILKGDVPSPINPPSGCAFRERCPFALSQCAEAVPPLEPVSDAHSVACIRRDIDLAHMEAS